MNAALPILVIASALLVGCGPPYRVLHQASPNPMAGGHAAFAVAPINFTGMAVGDTTEAGWMADKDEDQRRSWEDDKAAMNAEFQRTLSRRASEANVKVAPLPAGAPFVIHPKVTFLEPGFYTYFVNKESEVQMTVAISSADGRLVDEIAVSHQTAASLSNASSGQRLRDDAEALGGYVAEYLETRVGPGASARPFERRRVAVSSTERSAARRTRSPAATPR